MRGVEIQLQLVLCSYVAVSHAFDPATLKLDETQLEIVYTCMGVVATVLVFIGIVCGCFFYHRTGKSSRAAEARKADFYGGRNLYKDKARRGAKAAVEASAKRKAKTFTALVRPKTDYKELVDVPSGASHEGAQEAAASTSMPTPSPRPSTESGPAPVAGPRPSSDSTAHPTSEPRKSVSADIPKHAPAEARASSSSHTEARASGSSLSADRKMEPPQPRPPTVPPKQPETLVRPPTNPPPPSGPPGPPTQPSAPPRPRKEASLGKEAEALTHSRKNTHVAGNLLPLSRELLLKPYGEHGEETRLNTGRFMEHINNMRSVIHAIKVEKFPDEVAREVAELQRKKEKRPVSNLDEHTLLPSEVEAAKSDTRTLYALLVEDPQLALRRDFLWGYTLLHWAAKANNLRSVRLLLEAGADPRAQSHGGLTPLHTAAMGDKTDQIVQILMEKGADVDMKTNSGLKARDVARGEKRFLLQSRLDCWDFKVVKQVIPNLKSVYM